MGSKRHYTPELAVGLWLASDVQLSPDGAQVAFVVGPIGHETTNPVSAIWVASTDGQSAPRQLTAGQVEDRMPRWSPDGRQLAFLSDRAERGTAQVHLLSTAGGEAWPMTTLPRGADLLAWSPDGRWLTFIADRRALAGEQEVKDGPGITVASLADRPRVIVRLRAEGSMGMGTGTGAPSVVGPADGHVWAYAWSRDGRRIAVVTTAFNRLDNTVGNVRLLLLDPVAHAERTLRLLPFVPQALAWSPDGRWLVAINDTGEQPDDTRVILIDADRDLDAASDGDKRLDPGETTPLWVDWAGDGRLLVLTSEGLWTPFELIGSENGAATRLDPVPPGGSVTLPFSLGADGRTLALIRQEPTRPTEVWAGPVDGRLCRLTHLNPELDEVEFAAMEPIEWPASDGLTVQGWLLRPPGARPGERLPLIAAVHGGPSAAWRATFHATWHDWGQNLAAAGYAVLLPNPRGSTGRGPAFTAMNRGDLGGMDFDDVMRGIDWLIAQGIADPDRLGIGGWSYGGFLTAWAVTHSDRFKAAVVGAGVTNWPSKVGTTDIRPLNEARFAGPLREQPDALWERSPVRYLKHITTPTLVVHGEADPRVPVSQGLELHLGLRDAGVPTDFVTYPRQKHAFHEKAHQLDLLKRIVGWFERFIPPVRPA